MLEVAIYGLKLNLDPTGGWLEFHTKYPINTVSNNFNSIVTLSKIVDLLLYAIGMSLTFYGRLIRSLMNKSLVYEFARNVLVRSNQEKEIVD